MYYPPMSTTSPPPPRTALYRQLLGLSLPIMAGNFLHTLYNLADTYFLGRLGSAEVSAPGVSFNLLFLLIVLGNGFSSAGLTLIAQARGRADRENQEFYLGQLVSIMALGSLAVALPVYLLLPLLLNLLQVPGDVLPLVHTYLGIMLLGLPLTFLYNAFQSTMQALGDSLTPFIIQGITVLLNIALDWLFIFGGGPFPAWGVAGAAGATILSQGLAVAAGFFILIRGVRGISLHARHLIPRPRALSTLARIGLPAAAGQSGSALGFNVLQGIVNSLGTPVIAAFSIGNRIINLFMLPAMGMSQGATVIIAEKLGARNKDEARTVLRQAVITIFIFITIGMTYTFFRGDLFVGFFVSDPRVERLGTDLFRIVSPSVILFSLFTVVTAAFQGSGDTKPIMALNILRLWGLRVPLAWALVVLGQTGPIGIWISMFISNLGVALLGFILLAKRPWMDYGLQLSHQGDSNAQTLRDC